MPGTLFVIAENFGFWWWGSLSCYGARMEKVLRASVCHSRAHPSQCLRARPSLCHSRAHPSLCLRAHPSQYLIAHPPMCHLIAHPPMCHFIAHSPPLCHSVAHPSMRHFIAHPPLCHSVAHLIWSHAKVLSGTELFPNHFLLCQSGLWHTKIVKFFARKKCEIFSLFSLVFRKEFLY